MPRTRAAGLLVVVLFCAFGAWAFASGARVEALGAKRSADHAEGLAAWEQVYTVLTHPRCINCHTATNYPQQGDERRRHFANVVRGPEGKGVPGLNCVSCHQKSNADSTGVPGGPDWHLAPLSMKWQDENDQPLPSATVCRQVIDRRRNGNLNAQGLLKHHEEAALVLWAWEPGRRLDGSVRATPPITHAEFVAATRRWVEAGTPCPSSR
jgi:mono/diheme cytochrome c family protein